MPDKKIKIRNEEDKTIYECRLEQNTNKKVPVAKYIIITIYIIIFIFYFIINCIF